jgi:hypothetical protein
VNRFTLIAACCLTTFVLFAPGLAKNVDLSTVPDRDTVQLTIYNSADLTLVRETRKVTFKQGANPLQFSWANTLIDPSSVELRFKTNGEKLSVVDTTFPHDKPQMLYWNVASDFNGEATIEITYFTSGISWSADYTAIADAAEKTMAIDGFVRVNNQSGEDYEDAQVRLIVGQVNLVEQIAALAHRAAQLGNEDAIKRLEQLKQDTAWKFFERESGKGGQLGDFADELNDIAEDLQEAKAIDKESLGEYFIYTVEGTESIPHGWSKRMRSFDAVDVEFKIQYRYRPAEYGDKLMRMYLLTNNEESKLGQSPLPDGVVRVFRNNGRDGLSYLTAHTIKYIPIGDKIELPLGVDPDVVFELVKLRAWRDNIWMKLRGVDVYRQVGDGNVEIEARSTVAGWDEHAVYSQRVRNYTGKPIELEIRRPFHGDVTFHSSLDPKLHDFRTPEFTATVQPGKTSDLLFEIVTKQGRNAKQDRVTLEQASVKR